MIDYCIYKGNVIDKIYVGDKEIYTFPLSGNPDRRLRLNMYADSTGLKFWNSAKDKMPILGLDMKKGIEFYCKEFVPGSHKIYTDGEVMKLLGYAGVGDSYNKSIQIIYEEETARGTDVMAKTHPTSSIEFHRMLVNQLNEDNIAKVEREHIQLLSIRNVLEEEIPPLVKTEQRVITSINFAIRADLVDFSLYIGTGYENLVHTNFKPNTDNLKLIKSSEGYFRIQIVDTPIGVSYYLNVATGMFDIDTTYSVLWDLKSDNFDNVTFYFEVFGGTESKNELKGNVVKTSASEIVPPARGCLVYLRPDSKVGNYIEGFIQITKTSTPKPFVQSHMPSGKLAFITNATSETHSFVMKEIMFSKYGSQNSNRFMFDNLGQYVTIPNLILNMKHNLYYSTKTNGVNVSKQTFNSFKNGLKVFSYGSSANGDFDSFSQLLIYENDERGGMTQIEMEGELAKDIKII